MGEEMTGEEIIELARVIAAGVGGVAFFWFLTKVL